MATTYTHESSSVGWLIAIIVALALLAMGYLVYSTNNGPADGSKYRYPPIYAPLLGSIVVGAEETSVILKQQDGTCVALESETYREMWYSPVTCPASEPAPAN